MYPYRISYRALSSWETDREVSRIPTADSEKKKLEVRLTSNCTAITEIRAKDLHQDVIRYK